MTMEDRRAEAIMSQHLYYFVQRAFSALHDGREMTPAWHIRAICWHLEQVENGSIRRLVINVPPRHLKSICTSVAFAAWLLGRNPAAKILVASYSEGLADKHARDFRTVIESDWFRNVFPALNIERSITGEFTTQQSGSRCAVSAGGTITGLGGDYLIVDDLAKAEDMNSATERARIKRIYDETLASRLDNPLTGRIIIIQQRLHEDDLVAHLLEKGGFVHLNLPAIADQDQEIAIGEHETHFRTVGDVLFPEHFPREALEQIRRTLGSYVFSAQYLQNPTPLDGDRLRWEWFHFYDERPSRAACQYVVQSWDTAFTAEPTSDYSVCTTWGILGEALYVLNVVRVRLEYPELKRRVLSEMREWNASMVIIEHANCGITLTQELRRAGSSQVISCKPRLNKEVRFATQLDKVCSGQVWLPRKAAWVEAFRNELMAFPNGRNDDQVDSFSQFLEWYGFRGRARLGRQSRAGSADGPNRLAHPSHQSASPRPATARRRFPSVHDGRVRPGFDALFDDLV